MTTQPDLAAVDAPTADAAGSIAQPAAVAAAPVASHTDAVEIAQLCALAGRTDLIAGFLETRATPERVRSHLLAARAEASPEIASRIDPQAPVVSADAGHPASPAIRCSRPSRSAWAFSNHDPCLSFKNH